MVDDDEAIVPARMDPLAVEVGSWGRGWAWARPEPEGFIISMVLLVSGVDVFGRC